MHILCVRAGVHVYMYVRMSACVHMCMYTYTCLCLGPFILYNLVTHLDIEIISSGIFLLIFFFMNLGFRSTHTLLEI